MAHVKQGIYKKYLNRYRELVKDVNSLLENVIDDYEIAWDFITSADVTYCDINILIHDFQCLLESQTLEQTERKYQDIIEELKEKAYTLETKANELYQMMGPDFSPTEESTLSQLSIVKRRY